MELIPFPRGRNPRTVRCEPAYFYFKPRGVPLVDIKEEVAITIEELEAIRLSDFERLKQEVAAKRMNISQSSISRHLESAHHKIAKALLFGMAIRIGNPIDYVHCEECGYIQPIEDVKAPTGHCGQCKSTKLHLHIHTDGEHKIQSIKQT